MRFEKWLKDNGHPATLASLERTVLIASKQHLETLPQQPLGSMIPGERSRNADSELERSIGERNQGDPPLGLHGDDPISGLAKAPSNGSEERGAAMGHDA